jgi:hypothetical protein
MDDSVLEQSLEQLENERWPPPNYDSYLVLEAHRLRSVPIGDLTVEDLRLLLGQQIGTRYLMPLAVARLQVEPLAQGDFYPGDLLSSVLETDPSYWDEHPDQLLALNEVRKALMRSGESGDLLADKRWPSAD